MMDETQPDMPSSQMPGFRRRGRRRARRRFLVALLLLLIAGLIAPRLLGHIIAGKLQSEVSTRLHGRLDLRNVRYLFPYGVRIDHASLYAGASSTQPALEVASLQIKLARFPFGAGPLIFEQAEIRNPIVRIIHTDSGFESAPLPAHQPGVPPEEKRKLSDLFELRHLSIVGGQVIYEDRASSLAAGAALIWKNIGLDFRLTPAGAADYRFIFTANDPAIAKLAVDGAINIDTLDLDVPHWNLELSSDINHPSEELPPQIQAIFQKYAIGGHVVLAASAKIPLKDPSRAALSAQLDLRDGACRLHGSDGVPGTAEFTLTAANAPVQIPGTLPASLPAALADDGSDILFHLTNFKLAGGDQLLKIDSAEGRLDRGTGIWAVGKVHGLTEAGEGPGPLRLSYVQYHIPFTAAGFGRLDSPRDFRLRVAVDKASGVLFPRRLPVTQVAGQLQITHDRLTCSELTGTICGGAAALHGQVAWNDRAVQGITYQAEGALLDADMAQIGQVFVKSQKARERFTGSGDLHAAFSGSFPKRAATQPTSAAAPLATQPGVVVQAATGLPATATDRFTAAGDFDIRRGNFYQIPVLKSALSEIKEPDAATVGEAAAVFSIDHRIIHFDEAEANSPALGVQGSGDIDFDGDVDMKFIVTPLADWRQKLQDTGVPIVKDIVAFVAGAAEFVINTAEKVVVYQYRVTGRIPDPKSQTVPLPVLTDAMKQTFQKMAGDRKDNSLSAEMRARRTVSTTRPAA